jgi:hypothetical protein
MVTIFEGELLNEDDTVFILAIIVGSKLAYTDPTEINIHERKRSEKQSI